ncbi:Gluconokinase [Streptomyces misionensis JCM 4497]
MCRRDRGGRGGQDHGGPAAFQAAGGAVRGGGRLPLAAEHRQDVGRCAAHGRRPAVLAGVDRRLAARARRGGDGRCGALLRAAPPLPRHAAGGLSGRLLRPSDGRPRGGGAAPQRARRPFHAVHATQVAGGDAGTAGAGRAGRHGGRGPAPRGRRRGGAGTHGRGGRRRLTGGSGCARTRRRGTGQQPPQL